MGTKKKTVLYIYSYLSSFVKKDIEILFSQYEVKTFDFHTSKRSGTPLRFISQKLFLLKNIWTTDLIVCQFAGYSSFLPTLFGRLFLKPSIIVVGGTDAVSFPSVGYGNFNKKLLGVFTKWSYRLCSHIAPKHKTLMLYDYDYEPDDFPQQGILFHCLGLQKQYTEITNGYDATKWYCNREKRPNTFITVSGGWDYHFQFQLKGIDLIVSIAPLFPECEFIIVGMPDEKLIPQKPSNLKILPPTQNDKLIDRYSESDFYLQLSMAEGFPNALCEAMLCECIPIGSNVFSIPEIIGDSGFVLKHKSMDELSQLISQAINADRSLLRKKARKRIADNYPFELRKEKLLALCKQLIEK